MPFSILGSLNGLPFLFLFAWFSPSLHYGLTRAIDLILVKVLSDCMQWKNITRVGAILLGSWGAQTKVLNNTIRPKSLRSRVRTCILSLQVHILQLMWDLYNSHVTLANLPLHMWVLTSSNCSPLSVNISLNTLRLNTNMSNYLRTSQPSTYWACTILESLAQLWIVTLVPIFWGGGSQTKALFNTIIDLTWLKNLSY